MNLKIKSLECIKENIREVIKSEDWKSLKAVNPDLVDDVLMFSTNNHSIETTLRLTIRQISKMKKAFK